MKKIISYIILIFILSCNSPKRIYKDVCVGVPKHYQDEILKKNLATDENHSLLYFTENFDNEKIVITNNNIVLFEDYVTSIEDLGFASMTQINNDFETDIFLENKKYHFKIEKNKYKFIYISKTEKNRLVVKYSNKFCGFR